MNQPWFQQPVQLHLDSNVLKTDLDKARRDGTMNAELCKLGLEPTKQAYEQKMNLLRAADQQSQVKEQSRFSRFLFGKREKVTSTKAMVSPPCLGDACRPAPKPCRGKNCKPQPPPPCTGKNCKPAPPPTNVPWGYIDHCDYQASCYARLARVNPSQCDAILRRLRDAEQRASVLAQARQTACSADPQGAQCTAAATDYQSEELIIEQLRRQYQMCTMAATP